MMRECKAWPMHAPHTGVGHSLRCLLAPLCPLGLSDQVPLRQPLGKGNHDSPSDVIDGRLKCSLGQQHLVRNLVLQ